MTTHELLVAGKGYLLNHGWWNEGGAGPFVGWAGGPRCMIGAVYEVGLWEMPARRDALDALREYVGDDGCIPMWNDRPDRTLDEVIAAFDRAIMATAPEATPASQPETPFPSVTHVFA